MCLLRGSLLGMGTLSYLNPVHYSQLDPDQAEALRQRLGRARKVKLYLLQQSGSNSFLVAGDEKNQKNQKYKVNIGPQVCSTSTQVPHPLTIIFCCRPAHATRALAACTSSS